MARKTLADQRYSHSQGNERLDHCHTGYFHCDPQLRLVWTKQLVHDLARVSGPGKDEELLHCHAEGHGAQTGQWIRGAYHQHQSIAEDALCDQARRLDGQRHNADIDRSIVNSFQDFAAKVAINADLNLRIESTVLFESLGQDVKTGCLVGAYRKNTARGPVLIRNSAHRLISKSKQLCPIFKEHLSRSGREAWFRSPAPVDESGRLPPTGCETLFLRHERSFQASQLPGKLSADR